MTATTTAPRRRASGRAATRARRLTTSRAPHRPVGRRSPTFVGLFGIVVVLSLLGLVMVLSASSVAALDELGDSYYYFKRQAIWLAIGFAAMVLIMRADYRRWRRYAVPLVVAAAVLLVLVCIPHIGLEVNGSRRWLGYGALRVQPSELAKLAVVLFGADLLARRGKWMSESHVTLRPVLIVTTMLAGLVVIGPDLGSAVIIVVLGLVMLWVAGAPPLALAAVTAGYASAGAALALYEPYRRARLTAFMDPWADVQDTGWQTVQSLVGISSGGITGVGLGASRAKWGFLPFAHTDFIFAVISEELGLIGALMVLMLFAAFGVLGVRAATHAPDRFGALLAGGITVGILAQAFINMGAVVGVLPVTGVTLPFVSAGGSSLVVTMVATGMLLSVARQGR